MGLVLVSPKKITIKKSLRLGFSAINNKVEYEVLLMGMMMVQKMGGKTMKVFSDSKLVVGQVRGDLEARDPRMQEYLSQVRRIQTKFEFFDLSHILEVKIPMQTLWLPSPHPRHRISPE